MNDKLKELLSIVGCDIITNHSMTADKILDCIHCGVDDEGEIINLDTGEPTGIRYEEIELGNITNQYTQNPVTMKVEQAATYVRVSTQEQKLHGLSLDAQKTKLTEYAEKNNMRIVERYIDD